MIPRLFEPMLRAIFKILLVAAAIAPANLCANDTTSDPSLSKQTDLGQDTLSKRQKDGGGDPDRGHEKYERICHSAANPEPPEHASILSSRSYSIGFLRFEFHRMQAVRPASGTARLDRFT
jgi:hypothetical protein